MAELDTYPGVDIDDDEEKKKSPYPIPVPATATAPMPQTVTPADLQSIAVQKPPTVGEVPPTPAPIPMTREPNSNLVQRGAAVTATPAGAPAPTAAPPIPPGPQPSWSNYAAPEHQGIRHTLGQMFIHPQEGPSSESAQRQRAYENDTQAYNERVAQQEKTRAATSTEALQAAQAKEHEAGAAAKTAGMENIQVQIPPELGGGTANIPKGKEEDFFKALAQIRGRENAAENKPAPKQNDFEQYYNDFITENKLPDSAHNRLLAREKYASAGQTPQRPDAEDKAVSDHLAAQGLPDTPQNRDRARLDLSTGKVTGAEEAKNTAKIAELGKSAQASYKRLQALADKDNDPANYAFLMSFIGMSYEAIKGARLNQAEIVRAAATRTLPDQLQHWYDLYVNKRVLTKEQKTEMLDTAKTIAGTYEENPSGNEGQKFNEGDRRTHKQTGEVQEYRGGKWQTVTPPKQ